MRSEIGQVKVGGRRSRKVALAAVSAFSLLLFGCSVSPTDQGPIGSTTTSMTSSGTSGTSTTSAPGPTAAQLAAERNGASAADTDRAGVEWLCRPGQASDPCTASLTATVLPASGQTTVQQATDAVNPPIDCFYVYPTVSSQPGILANLQIDPAETAVAEAQASRFSESCRVYAPMYPQLTLHAITDTGQVTAADLETAYRGVAAAWADYLANYNDGRGVVVIGHSQGAAMLIALLRLQVDHDSSVRKRLVSAIILGGNVTVPIGKEVGGSFDNIPACSSFTETGCVVAYSSFDTQPPPDSLFGRPGQGVSGLVPGARQNAAGMEILCVNPADPKGGVGGLDPYFPSALRTAGLGSEAPGAPRVSTPWIEEPDLYSGECRYSEGASWLQVSAPVNPGDTRAIVTQSIGPTWGLHLVDVNIALGNLVALVHDEAAAYANR